MTNAELADRLDAIAKFEWDRCKGLRGEARRKNLGVAQMLAASAAYWRGAPTHPIIGQEAA